MRAAFNKLIKSAFGGKSQSQVSHAGSGHRSHTSASHPYHDSPTNTAMFPRKQSAMNRTQSNLAAKLSRWAHQFDCLDNQVLVNEAVAIHMVILGDRENRKDIIIPMEPDRIKGREFWHVLTPAIPSVMYRYVYVITDKEGVSHLALDRVHHSDKLEKSHYIQKLDISVEKASILNNNGQA